MRISIQKIDINNNFTRFVWIFQLKNSQSSLEDVKNNCWANNKQKTFLFFHWCKHCNWSISKARETHLVHTNAKTRKRIQSCKRVLPFMIDNGHQLNQMSVSMNEMFFTHCSTSDGKSFQLNTTLFCMQHKGHIHIQAQKCCTKINIVAYIYGLGIVFDRFSSI